MKVTLVIVRPIRICADERVSTQTIDHLIWRLQPNTNQSVILKRTRNSFSVPLNFAVVNYGLSDHILSVIDIQSAPQPLLKNNTERDGFNILHCSEKLIYVLNKEI